MESGELEITSLKSGTRQPKGRRPTSARRRLLVTCGSALALLLAVTGLLLSTQPNPGEALNTLLGIPPPTPTAPLALGASIFYVAHRVPWGVLTIDGTRNDASDVDITESQPNDPQNGPPNFILTRGHHQVAYDAPPFAPLRCVVTVPAAPRDTCPLAVPDQIQSQLYIVGAARILDLGSTLANLPAQAMADLVVAATKAISISTPTILAHAGERYLGTDAQTHSFAQDAQVTLFRAPWPGTLSSGQTNCQFLCPSTGGGDGVTAWTISAEVRQGYHYTAAAAGGAAPDDTPLAVTLGSGGPQASLESEQDLAVSWSGRWQVTLANAPGQSLVCQAASEMFSGAVYGTTGGGAYSPPMQVVSLVAAANPAEGCVVGVQEQGPLGTAGTTINLLFRFGVLLTVDAAGRTALPDFLAADAQEQALAQQILAHKA